MCILVMNVTKCVFVYFSHVCMCTCSYYTVIYIYMMCVCTCVIHYTHQTKIHKPMCTYIVVVIIYIYYSHDMTKQKS